MGMGLTVDGFGAAMWEKCGTYSRRERAEGAVRHVLPQAGGGVGGGGVGEPGTGIIYTYVLLSLFISVCCCLFVATYTSLVKVSYRVSGPLGWEAAGFEL